MLSLGLIVPRLLLMIFACIKYPPKSIPVWIPIGWGFYLLAAITFMAVFGPRIFRPPAASAASAGLQASAKSGAIRLLAVWSGLFLYRAFKFAKGEIASDRAIPAGFLLLAWIVMLAWLMRRDVKRSEAAENAQTGGEPTP